MREIEVRQWCDREGYILISPKKRHLTEVEVISIAKLACDVTYIGKKDRNQYRVFARYLYYYYFDRFSSFSLNKIGSAFNINHATVIHHLDTFGNEMLIGWRKKYKIYFEELINDAHKHCGIEKRFR
jgi:chromosomal replication initiation ATPase DnaA